MNTIAIMSAIAMMIPISTDDASCYAAIFHASERHMLGEHVNDAKIFKSQIDWQYEDGLSEDMEAEFVAHMSGWRTWHMMNTPYEPALMRTVAKCLGEMT